jgi:hypothetical protein
MGLNNAHPGFLIREFPTPELNSFVNPYLPTPLLIEDNGHRY